MTNQKGAPFWFKKNPLPTKINTLLAHSDSIIVKTET